MHSTTYQMNIRSQRVEDNYQPEDRVEARVETRTRDANTLNYNSTTRQAYDKVQGGRNDQ